MSYHNMMLEWEALTKITLKMRGREERLEIREGTIEKKGNNEGS